MFCANFTDYMRYESDDSKIFRPNGSGDYIFIYFPLPMVFVIDGQRRVTKKGACIFYKPDSFQHFYAYEHFCNSFVHFTDNSGAVKQFNIPFGKIFYPQSAAKMNEIIKKIKEEILKKEDFSEQMISSYIMQILILTQRSIKDEEQDELQKQFIELRKNMLEDYKHEHSIYELAAAVCMSKSRFYDYYRQYFNSSPKQDLLSMRMEAAQSLLTNKSKTTAEIAADVGFDNVEHFTRYYKKYFGVSPRRKN